MYYRTCCPLCKSDKFKVIEKIKSEDKNFYKIMESEYKIGSFLKKNNYCYELSLCQSCGSRYQNFVPTEREIKDLYSINISAEKSFIKQVINYKKNLSVRRKTALLIKNLIKYKIKDEYKVLDIGAGWGFFAHLGSEFNLKFTTLEIFNFGHDNDS